VKINREAGSWLDQDITWWLNGSQYHQITGRSVQARGGVEADWVSLAQSPMHIILNVAVGGGYPGNPNSSTGKLLCDSVAADLFFKMLCLGRLLWIRG